MGTTVTAVLVASWLFYRADRGHNPKVTTFHDALVYVSTNLSVGFSDIFAQTPLGKVLGSALMTWGPALATRAFDPPVAVPSARNSLASAVADPPPVLIGGLLVRGTVSSESLPSTILIVVSSSTSSRTSIPACRGAGAC